MNRSPTSQFREARLQNARRINIIGRSDPRQRWTQNDLCGILILQNPTRPWHALVLRR